MHRYYLIVQRIIVRNFHSDIIRSETVHRRSRFGTLQENGHCLSDMAGIKRTCLFVRQIQQKPAASVLFLGRHHMLYLQSLRTRTFGIAEHMKLRHIQTLNKPVCLLKVFFRFSTRSYNHVHTDKGIRHHFLYPFHFRSKQRRIISSAHQFQHFITTRLQRNMEMRHKPLGTGYKLNDFVRQQVRFNRRYAIALNAFHIVQRLYQVEEGFSRRLSEITDVYPCQYNLPTAFGCCLTSLFHQRCDASVTTAAAGKRKNLVNDDAAKKKKRNRINKERVDINAAGTTNVGGASNNNQRNDNANRPNRNNNSKPNSNNNQGGGKFNKDRFKKPVVKAEVSDEDVAKQVKETLARLTNKTKNKAAKYRKEKRENVQNRLMEQEEMEQEDSKILKLTEFVTANELASMMDIPVTQVIATCMSIGIMVSINQRLDAETINLVAEEFGYKTEYVSAEVAQAITEEEDNEEDLQPRAPIVTVMGHVDHGKTSLLDYIRKANVIAGEAGGITQHIGAYNVKLEDGRHITFLDTPGHEAFTAMRARGAKVTDIAIIIVAADDNVMPQTKEAINHAMAAGVPIVFAINKVDKPHANPDKIKEELAAMNFLVEEWGGKYQSQDISAKKGTGVHDLLEKVLLEAEMLDLKANPDRKATGSIIESSLDKGRGYVATMLVANGTLKMGDIVLAGTSYGKVKAMFNERNQRIKEAGPSEPVLILGLNGAPAAGDTFHVIDTEQEARDIANKREQLQREQGLRTQKLLTLDEVGRRLALGDFHELNVIVKGDVDGSVEALSDSLIKLSTEQVQVNVIHKGVGQISESDVTLAAASDAIIVGFQVRPSSSAGKLAEQEGVDIRKYSVIYDAIEEVKAAMEGMLAPTLKEQITATIEVREVFNITKVGLVAGAMVKTGKVKRSDKARLIRDGIVVFTGAINALKRFKDDVKEVGTNFECGISLTNCNDIKVGDIIEAYEEVEVKQTL